MMNLLNLSKLLYIDFKINIFSIFSPVLGLKPSDEGVNDVLGM